MKVTIRGAFSIHAFEPAIPQKTRHFQTVCRATCILGFQIQRKKIRWTDKSQKKLKEKVRAITKRTRGASPSKVIADLNQYLRGAINYYACGIPYREILALDRWMRRRVRLYPLEAMGETTHPKAQTRQSGHRPRRGAHGKPQPQRALENEPQQHRESGDDRRVVTRARRSRPEQTMDRHSLSGRSERTARESMTDWNRRMRIRMSGGVGGEG